MTENEYSELEDQVGMPTGEMDHGAPLAKSIAPTTKLSPKKDCLFKIKVEADTPLPGLRAAAILSDHCYPQVFISLMSEPTLEKEDGIIVKKKVRGIKGANQFGIIDVSLFLTDGVVELFKNAYPQGLSPFEWDILKSRLVSRFRIKEPLEKEASEECECERRAEAFTAKRIEHLSRVKGDWGIGSNSN